MGRQGLHLGRGLGAEEAGFGQGGAWVGPLTR